MRLQSALLLLGTAAASASIIDDVAKPVVMDVTTTTQRSTDICILGTSQDNDKCAPRDASEHRLAVDGVSLGVDTTSIASNVPMRSRTSENATNSPESSAEADPTKSKPAEVTGGALPQPMKASAAGLLGFFIMSLVML